MSMQMQLDIMELRKMIEELAVKLETIEAKINKQRDATPKLGKTAVDKE